MVKRGELRVSAVTEGGIQLFERADVERLANQRAVRRMGGVKDGA
jgi:hypothetical protein